MKSISQLQEILQNFPNEYSIGLIRILPKIGGKETTEEKGAWLDQIYSTLHNAIDGIEECRCQWDEFYVFHPVLDLKLFEAKVITVLGSLEHKKLETHSLFAHVSDKNETLKCLDELQLQLHKVNYWVTHVYEYYYLNGKRLILSK